MATITLRGPQSGDLRAFLPNANLLGRAATGPRYRCLSRNIAALATGLLKIPTIGYFGDFGFTTPLQLNEEARLACAELESSKSARSQILEVLGLVLGLPPFPGSPPPLLYSS